VARPGVSQGGGCGSDPVAVRVAYKEVGGRRTDQLAIRVHVETKTDQIPEDQRVPTTIAGVTTDVLQRRVSRLP